MFSGSHFRDFLADDRIGKQIAVPKRGQKTTSNEGSPRAKARPCLEARDLKSEESLHKV